MAQSVRVINKLSSFKDNLYTLLELALRDAARDTLISARNKAPFRKGPLRSNSEFKRVGSLHQRVSFWLEYARYQEFGGDGTKVVRNYSAPGTGKAYLSTSGNKQAETFNLKVLKYAQRAKT